MQSTLDSFCAQLTYRLFWPLARTVLKGFICIDESFWLAIKVANGQPKETMRTVVSSFVKNNAEKWSRGRHFSIDNELKMFESCRMLGVAVKGFAQGYSWRRKNCKKFVVASSFHDIIRILSKITMASKESPNSYARINCINKVESLTVFLLLAIWQSSWKPDYINTEKV